jgi:hypothetical protein
MHRTTKRFWNRFYELPPPIQDIAQENFAILKENPRHPSLHFKKVGKLWSARVGRDYRALAVEHGPDFVWVWIGTHDEYKQMIKETG